MPTAAKPSFASLQVGRAIAASIVVLWHLSTIDQGAKAAVSQAPWWISFGYAGVDIFFVFSGFIISLVISKSPRWDDFLFSRARRILPFYWLFTMLALLAKLAKHVAFDAKTVLLSFLILPQRELPSLFVGWSLEHEAIFYLIAAVLLVANRRGLLPLILAMLFMIGVVLHVVVPMTGRPDPWDFHLASLYQLDFLSGVLIWQHRARLQTIPWLIPAAIAAALLGIGGHVIARAYHFDHIPTDPSGLGGLTRVILFGAAGTALLVALLSLEASHTRVFGSILGKALHQIGDASYGLYLSHPLIIGSIAAVVAKQAFGPPLILLMKGLAFGVAIAFSLIWYHYAEAPWLARFRSERRPAELQQMDGPD